MPEQFPQYDYEVVYPDGKIVPYTAHMIYSDSAIIGLKKAPGDNPRNWVFAASHEAGIAIGLANEGIARRLGVNTED